MTDDGPASPRRPATARPRHDAPEPTPDSRPTDQELDAIERQLATRMANSGADVSEDADAGVWWVRFDQRTPTLSFAMRVRWPAPEADERLAALEVQMRERGDWPSVSVSEGLTQPSNLAATLAAAGWKMVSGERIHFARHPPTVPHLDPTLRIEAVTPASARECVELEVANFGLPQTAMEDRAAKLAALVVDGSERAFIVRHAKRAVASARLTPGRSAGVAALSSIGVAAGQRGRGYGRLVTSVATRAGLATGARLVWLSVDEANAPAISLYRSLGYEPAYAWARWIAPA